MPISQLVTVKRSISFFIDGFGILQKANLAYFRFFSDSFERKSGLFQIFRVQALQLVDDEKTVFANQNIVEPDFTASVFRTLNHD